MAQCAGKNNTYFLWGGTLSKRIQALTEKCPRHRTQKEPLGSGGDREGHVKGIRSKMLMGFQFFGGL